MREAVRIAGANLLHLHVAAAFRDALANAGVQCLYLKGIAYLDTLYELHERELSDVDVLVPKRAQTTAFRVASELGWVAIAAPRSHRRGWLERYNQPFRTPNGPLVEVHVGLAPAGLFSIDMDAMFARAVTRPGRLGATPMLSAEDTLLALAVHEAKHGLEVPVKNRQDIARVIAAWSPDWDVVTKRARAWRAETATYMALARARHEQDAHVPDAVLAALAPRQTRRAVLQHVAAREWRRMGALLAADRPAPALAHYFDRRVRDVLMAGHSMQPVLHPGDRVRVEASVPKRGDVVAVDAGGGTLLVHAVTKTGDQEVVTRGIAHRENDTPWPRERIVGVVAELETAAGKIISGRTLKKRVARAMWLRSIARGVWRWS
jgi:hypothetical protein